MYSVNLNNVTKKWGDVTAVDQVNLHINEGEFVVLLGPSGCGKTTTMRLVAGLEDITDGEIKIGEKKHDKVKDSTLILLSKGEDLKVTAQTNTKFLVISGKPINEEIARGGPFVMNTKAEILQAVQDYHNGTFVK